MKSSFNLDQGKKTLIADRKMTGTLSASLNNLRKEVTVTSLLPVTIILPNNYLHLPVGEYFRLKPLGGSGLYDF